MKTKNILLIILFALSFAGCKKDPESMKVELSLTSEVVTARLTTATIEAEYSYPSVMKKVTIHYSESEDMSNEKTSSAEILTYSFSVYLTGLKELTQYYYYYEFDNGLASKNSEIKNFKTVEWNNSYDYVDLGLPSGLKWATCNVGASSPEEYGNYYAWGETEPKSSYTKSNSITYGEEMDDISGNPQYDAARANWGGTWRMPTKAEFEELLDECTWTWTTQSGTNGYRVTGPNSNSIFLPAAGYRDGTSLYYAGTRGLYWSSTPLESYTYSAHYLLFSSSDLRTNWDYRYLGHTVRPVSE